MERKKKEVCLKNGEKKKKEKASKRVRRGKRKSNRVPPWGPLPCPSHDQGKGGGDAKEGRGRKSRSANGVLMSPRLGRGRGEGNKISKERGKKEGGKKEEGLNPSCITGFQKERKRRNRKEKGEKGEKGRASGNAIPLASVHSRLRGDADVGGGLRKRKKGEKKKGSCPLYTLTIWHGQVEGTERK